MKHFLLFLMLISSTLILSGCSNPEPTITETTETQLEELTAQAEQMSQELEATQRELDELLQEVQDNTKVDTNEQDLLNDLANSETVSTNTGASQGSCDSITETSICTEYLGEWDETEMKLHCVSEERFSTASCPSDALGGCSIIMGENSSLTSWYYNYGSDPVSSDSIVLSELLCTTTPGSTWMTK